MQRPAPRNPGGLQNIHFYNGLRRDILVAATLARLLHAK
jgi:hypothetical protein